ncbi:MAG: hypothetical protein ACE14T_03665 [Syntrophales bacterium]
MKAKILLISLIVPIVLCFFLYSSLTDAKNESSCITCHTSETLLKLLCKVPEIPAGVAEGRAGAPPPVKAQEYYRVFLVDKGLLEKDTHFKRGCGYCHKGDEAGVDKESAHKGLVRRPSDNLNTCRKCHMKTAQNYGNSLHYTTAGQRTGVIGRFSVAEAKIFDEKVFEKSCRSCHASCGDCHVQSPVIGGINIGFIKGHKFVKKDEGKTCALCHGGRVYSEFTGGYGGNADIHYQRGMLCMGCHKTTEMHGDGNRYLSREEIKEKPSCGNCHAPGGEKNLVTRLAHSKHEGKVSCYACHCGGEYHNCYNCHLGAGAVSQPGFMLGLNPRDRKTVTTLRLVPAVRDTFLTEGIKMAHFDALPNYWNSPVHNIRKRTDRTRSCDSCHIDRKGFLTKEMLIENGSKANERLLYTPRPIDKY